MKTVLKITAFVLIFSLCSCVRIRKSENTPSENDLRGVWISVFDMPLPIESEERFSENIEKMFSDIQQKNFNNVFVQVRAYCDAFYRSDIFPFSRFLTGVQGKDPGFDPMEIMIRSAHSHDLKFHAWINPYRILSENDPSKLSSDSPALKFIEKNDGSVYTCESGIYFNPASTQAQKLILDGVREIVKNYDVDGIHIDDYFYPTIDENIDKKQFESYGGDLSLNEWRMMNVNGFVSGMYSAVKSFDSRLTVSISPSGSIESNYSLHFADVKKWLCTQGYADLIIPQIYFGFENEENPFEKTLEEWRNLPRHENVKLAVGLALYKGGKEDEFAGSGKNEWLENSDIIKRQCGEIKDLGYVMYSYSYTENEEWKSFFGS